MNEGKKLDETPGMKIGLTGRILAVGPLVKTSFEIPATADLVSVRPGVPLEDSDKPSRTPDTEK